MPKYLNICEDCDKESIGLMIQGIYKYKLCYKCMVDEIRYCRGYHYEFIIRPSYILTLVDIYKD